MTDEENHNYVPDDLSNYRVVRKGNLVINKMKSWQGSLGISGHDGIVSPAYFVFDCVFASRFYLHRLLRSKTYVAFFAQASDGIRVDQWDLSIDRMKRIPVLAPPADEQAAIVRYLDHVDRLVRRYIQAKQKLIKLLSEQKQAIIHQAVTHGLDPNVRLKPSGVEWLGDVPEHWEVRRVKSLCQMKSGDGITAATIEPRGDYPVYGGNGVRGYTSNYTHEGQYILIGRQGALCGNVHVANGRFWASEHAVVVTLHSAYNVSWFAATLEVMNLNRYSIAAAQPGLAVERIMNLWLAVPPEKEQALIARHIEDGTVGLRQAFDRTEREIALLREYRTRLIADVVTGKVDVREAAATFRDELKDELPIEETAADVEEDAEEMMDANLEADLEEAQA